MAFLRNKGLHALPHDTALSTNGKDQPKVMLFNLAKDIGENNSLPEDEPEIVGHVTQCMKKPGAAVEAGLGLPETRPNLR